MLKPYRLDQGEFLSPLELALDHDVEIEEAGAKLGGRSVTQKCWGGKLEFLPCLFMLEFLHFPKKISLSCSLLSHNFTFFRQKLGHHQGRKSATPARMVCSFWAIA